MKRMKRKDQFINVVGAWDGTEEGDLLNWLTDNRYVYQIQTEDVEQVTWRTKSRDLTEQDKEPRKQLVVLGKAMYEEITMYPNQSILVAGETGRLIAYDLDVIEDEFEQV